MNFIIVKNQIYLKNYQVLNFTVAILAQASANRPRFQVQRWTRSYLRIRMTEILWSSQSSRLQWLGVMLSQRVFRALWGRHAGQSSLRPLHPAVDCLIRHLPGRAQMRKGCKRWRSVTWCTTSCTRFWSFVWSICLRWQDVKSERSWTQIVTSLSISQQLYGGIQSIICFGGSMGSWRNCKRQMHRQQWLQSMVLREHASRLWLMLLQLIMRFLSITSMRIDVTEAMRLKCRWSIGTMMTRRSWTTRRCAQIWLLWLELNPSCAPPTSSWTNHSMMALTWSGRRSRCQWIWWQSCFSRMAFCSPTQDVAWQRKNFFFRIKQLLNYKNLLFYI